MNRLLDLDADTRISVEDAINHPFFNTVRAEHLAASEENTIKWEFQQIWNKRYLMIYSLKIFKKN